MKTNTSSHSNKRGLRGLFIGLVASLLVASHSHASGILTPAGSPELPLHLDEHHVRVVINNGFARTEVEQVFSNPNAYDLEAIYTTPIPENGALSELRIDMGEKTIAGEVVRKQDADRIYQEEKDQGNDAGKASQEGYQHFEFAVSRVPANGSVRLHYAYYEPLVLDTGIGRYAYRVEEGGTDDGASASWTQNDVVESQFTVNVTLHSAWPIANVRTPNYGGQTDQVDDKTVRYSFSQQGGSVLNQDFVFYYKLQDNLPGRLEMLAHRSDENKPGTFMLLMTPGVDLQPLENGSDFVFVVDVSGSMKGKLHTLASGVSKAIETLRPQDRYRIVPFNTQAWDLHGKWRQATPDNVRSSIDKIRHLQANQGTNLYQGVATAMRTLDSDRVSSLVLVTDGVTNRGIVDPKRFYKLLHAQDVRFYGFLLGNSSNWPLMRLMCEASGGYYKTVSNNDDIIGEILLAKNKVAYQSMHQAELQIKGIQTFDVSDFTIGKIHYGAQLAFFGKYDQAGKAIVNLRTKISGVDKTYSTEIDFPAIDKDYPELERMWALDQVQKIQIAKMAGLADPSESDDAIADIGVAYQIVTEGTSMLALDDQGFARHNIERRNQQRVAQEQQARTTRTTNSGAQRADNSQPMYQGNAPNFGGGGGGAIEPWFAILVVIGGAGYLLRKRIQKQPARFLALAGLIAIAASSDLAQAQSHSRTSVHDSIANFWEVSETEATLPARVAPTPSRTQRNDTIHRPRQHTYNQHTHRPVIVRKTSPYPDKHSVTQSEDSDSHNGHFGFKLFDSIPLFKFEWGDNNQSQKYRYKGTLRR